MGFTFKFFDSTRIVMLHGAGAPPDDGWRSYLSQIRDRDLKTLGLLVFTNGGAPGPAQRKELNDVVMGRFFARAIVHDSVVVRGVVAAMSWFAPGAKAFGPDAWRSAASHARFTPDEMVRLASSVRRMHASLGESIPWLPTLVAQALTLPPRNAPPGQLVELERASNRPSRLDADPQQRGASDQR